MTKRALRWAALGTGTLLALGLGSCGPLGLIAAGVAGLAVLSGGTLPGLGA